MSYQESVNMEENENNVAISVASSPVSSVEPPEDTTVIGPVPEVDQGEEYEEYPIYSKTKRIIIGSMMLFAVIIPVVGGGLGTYWLRSWVHQPEDPYNVWPETEYRPSVRTGDLAHDLFSDIGYSREPNNPVLLNNDEEAYFEIVDKTKPNRAKVYMAIYLIENLFRDQEKFGLHVVSGPDPDDVSASIYNKLATYEDELVDPSDSRVSYPDLRTANFRYLSNNLNNHPYQKPVEYLGEELASRQTSSGGASDCASAKKAFAKEVRTIIESSRNIYCYQKAYGYIIPLTDKEPNIPILKDLASIRRKNRKDAEAEIMKSTKKKGPAKVPPKKPRFKHLVVRPISE